MENKVGDVRKKEGARGCEMKRRQFKFGMVLVKRRALKRQTTSCMHPQGRG